MNQHDYARKFFTSIIMCHTVYELYLSYFHAKQHAKKNTCVEEKFSLLEEMKISNNDNFSSHELS